MESDLFFFFFKSGVVAVFISTLVTMMYFNHICSVSCLWSLFTYGKGEDVHSPVCLYIHSLGAKQRKLLGAVPRGRPVPPPLPRGGCGGLPGGASVWAEPEPAGRGPATALPPPQRGAEERPPHLPQRGGNMEGTGKVCVCECECSHRFSLQLEVWRDAVLRC